MLSFVLPLIWPQLPLGWAFALAFIALLMLIYACSGWIFGKPPQSLDLKFPTPTPSLPPTLKLEHHGVSIAGILPEKVDSGLTDGKPSTTLTFSLPDDSKNLIVFTDHTPQPPKRTD